MPPLTYLTPTLPLLVAMLTAVAGCGGGDGAGADQIVYEPWVDPGTSEEFLGFDVLPELELLVEPDAVAALERNPRAYVKATIVFKGQRFGPVGLKVKGQNSFLPFSQKPSLRINVDEYVEGVSFYGLRDLTLNNMKSDPSMMHERLAYLVARESGIPASRCNHALLTVNGQFYGVYANVETVKKRMIGGWFDNNDGPLFEATDVDFTAQYTGGYQLESGPDDRSLISGLAQALSAANPDQAIAAAGQYVDIAHFQQFWAMESIVGQFDAFPYSLPGDDYFLYADPTSNQLWFIPWGMDETFFAADFSPVQVQSVLATTCKASPACYQGYVDRTWDLLAMTEAMGLDAQRAQIETALAPHLARDTRKPQTAAVLTEGQTQLGYFIRGRREILTGFLPPPSPQLGGP